MNYSDICSGKHKITSILLYERDFFDHFREKRLHINHYIFLPNTLYIRVASPLEF